MVYVSEELKNFLKGIRSILAGKGVRLKDAEEPWGENGVLWRFQFGGDVSTLIGAYYDTETKRSFFVLECGVGLIPVPKAFIISAYCTHNGYDFNYPFRFQIRDYTQEHVILVLHIRASFDLISDAKLPELINAIEYMGRHERRQLLELGLIPFEHESAGHQ